MASVYESNARLRRLPHSVAEQFGLTPPEATLCLGLLQGKSLSDLVDEQPGSRIDLQERYQTLLRKTGTDTEAKLITVVLSSTVSV